MRPAIDVWRDALNAYYVNDCHQIHNTGEHLAAVAVIEADRNAVRIAEREKIVAFIKEQRDYADKRLAECSHDKSAQNFAAASVACQRLAQFIEAGEHDHD